MPEARDEKVIDSRGLGWILDFSLDSVVNLNLRKTDKENFAVFNEGNLYNNLFYKVNFFKTSIDIFESCLEVDKEYKDSCDTDGEYCRFHKDIMTFLKYE